MKYYVYIYAYPEEMGGAVFYVGKGTGKRIDIHEIEARGGSSGAKRHEIIRSIWNAGYQVVKHIIFETDDESEAFAHENRTIKLHARTVVNIIANPYAVRPTLPPSSSTEEYFQQVFERAKWLNQSLVERYPENQREVLLKDWDAQSERWLRRRQAKEWKIA